MSRLRQRTFAFEEGNRIFEKARELDAKGVDRFSSQYAPNVNRFLMDEEPLLASLWRHSFDNEPGIKVTAGEIWSVVGAGIPLGWAPLIFLPLAILYHYLIGWGKRGLAPYLCQGCGMIVCQKCHSDPRLEGMCNVCYQALYHRESIPREGRHLQMRRMAKGQSTRARIATILNLFLPGMGFTLLKDSVFGRICLFWFILGSLVAAFWNTILPCPYPVWHTGGPEFLPLFMGGMVVAYLVIQILFIRKVRSKG